MPSFRNAAVALALAGSPLAAAQECIASTDTNYDSQLSGVIPGVTYYWKLTSTEIMAKMVYTGGDAWVAVGPAADSDGKMVGSEVVMGLPSPSNTVMKYELTQQGAAGVNAMGAQTLTGTSLSAAGGTTTMTYTKLLAEAGELSYSDSGPTPLVFAVGSGTSLGYHAARGAVEVDLATCVATTIKIKTMSTFNVFMHAALMIGAWMWLIPSGILTAVYKPHFGPGWIKLHMPLQYSAVACALCAFFIMVISVEDLGNDHFNPSETDFGSHTTLGGLVLFGFAIYQLVSGLVRPHKPEAGEATPLPRRVFEVTHKAMGYTALLVSWLAIMSGIEHASTLGLIDGKGPYLAATFTPLCLFLVLVIFKKAVYFKEGELFNK